MLYNEQGEIVMSEENKTLDYAEVKKEKRDIVAASEANVNHLVKVLDTNDFKSLVETRVILETNIAQLAALNRTEKDIKEIEKAMLAHRLKIQANEDAIDEDFLFRSFII